jgi:DNA-binding Lrp family transcriptional regulator
MIEKPLPAQFDTLDHQIIRQLPGNVRVDAAKIARAVGANERTVRKRINRLMELEAIQLAGTVNPRAFGYVVMAEALLQVDAKFEDDVVDCLLRIPEVAYLAYGQDDHDISVRAHFKDYGEMRDFMRRTLPAISGVTVINSRIVPRILYNMDRWTPKYEDFASK